MNNLIFTNDHMIGLKNDIKKYVGGIIEKSKKNGELMPLEEELLQEIEKYQENELIQVTINLMGNYTTERIKEL